MPRRVVWRRLAEEDLIQACSFLGADSYHVADRFLDAVQSATKLLASEPGAGRVREFQSPPAKGIRSWPVGGFQARLICYLITDGGIEIVRLLHGARDIQLLFEAEP